MSSIPNIIPQQNFEKLRDNIYNIIVAEFANQFTLSGNALFQANIFKERFINLDKTELPAVLVYFSRGEPIQTTKGQCSYNYYYNIEVHTNAKATASERGDTKASVDATTLLGAIRYILEGAHNTRLDFSVDEKAVSSIAVTEIVMGRNDVQNDGLNTSAGMITLRITSTEDNSALTSTDLDGTDSVDLEFSKLTVNKT